MRRRDLVRAWLPRRRARRRGLRLAAALAVVAVASTLVSPAAAEESLQRPAKPSGLEIATEAGSLEVGLDWDDVEGADRYWVRWRQAGPGNALSEGIEVEESEATVEVDHAGEWVVRIEACNDAGCGRPLAERFAVAPAPQVEAVLESLDEAEGGASADGDGGGGAVGAQGQGVGANSANAAPTVDTDAANYDAFTGTHNAPRGTVVQKNFEGIFSDPDSDTLTYTVSVPTDSSALVSTLSVHTTEDLVQFAYDDDGDWSAADPPLADPLTTTVTLTATDPDGLSASITGEFRVDWESQPKLLRAETYTRPGSDPPVQLLSVIFDRVLDTTTVLATSQFTVNAFNADGTSAGAIGVNSVAVALRGVDLTLASVPDDDQTLTVDYAADADEPITRSGGGDPAASFTGQAVTKLSLGFDTEDERHNAHNNQHQGSGQSGSNPAACTDQIELHSYSTLWGNQITPRRSWAPGCDSLALSGHHARWYSFTLTEEARVRLHAEGDHVTPPGTNPHLILRQGGNRDGNSLHEGYEYNNNDRLNRIEATLPAGTYTLEVTTTGPGMSSGFSLWAGTITAPKQPTLTVRTEYVAGDILSATLTLKDVDPLDFRFAALGCRETVANAFCSNALTDNSLTFDGQTNQVTAVVLEQATAGAAWSFDLHFDRPIPEQAFKDRLTVHIGSRELRVADATTVTGSSVSWSSIHPSSASFSANGSLSLRIEDSQGSQRAVAVHAADPPDDPCYSGIGRGDSFAQRWDASCASISSPGASAHYYSYIPEVRSLAGWTEPSEWITATLSSPDGDVRMYLWEGEQLIADTNSTGHSHAEFTNKATVGKAYTIEVVSDAQAGRYLLALRGRSTLATDDFDPDGTDAHTAGCTETIDFDTTTSGELGWPCYSVEQPGSYARYFTFTLSEARSVQVDMWSSQLAGTRMYLRHGTKGSGSHLVQSHYPPLPNGGVKARLAGVLAAGTYTIEATAAAGSTGALQVRLKPGPQLWQAPDECVSNIATLTTAWAGFSDGQWGEPCWSDTRSGSHARWYTFTLDSAATVRFNLSADDYYNDAWLYLRAGRTFTGAALAENNNERPYRWRPGWTLTDSSIVAELQPGTYTIEATTRRAPSPKITTNVYGMAYRLVN